MPTFKVDVLRETMFYCSSGRVLTRGQPRSTRPRVSGDYPHGGRLAVSCFDPKILHGAGLILDLDSLDESVSGPCV